MSKVGHSSVKCYVVKTDAPMLNVGWVKTDAPLLNVGSVGTDAPAADFGWVETDPAVLKVVWVKSDVAVPPLTSSRMLPRVTELVVPDISKDSTTLIFKA